ncbi:hypothetical protein [Streptomyces sp. NPDC093225]|uniref:hypothetical protein n=1 Tax=Streptomyces sp. NPDC093225 TaxID=3366034 RepID=UPI0037FC6907
MARVLATKKTERAGVDEFRALMESAGHIVQEIDGGNDCGEDCCLSFTPYGERTGRHRGRPGEKRHGVPPVGGLRHLVP